MADKDRTKLSYQLPTVYAEKLKTLSEGVHRTPSAITRELITALCDGKIKLPMAEASQDVYDTSPTK